MIDFHQLQYYVVDNYKVVLHGEREAIHALASCIVYDLQNITSIDNKEAFEHNKELIKQWLKYL